MIDEKLLREAAPLARDRELRALPEREAVPRHDFSPAFERNMRRLRHPWRRRVLWVLLILAALAAVALLAWAMGRYTAAPPNHLSLRDVPQEMTLVPKDGDPLRATYAADDGTWFILSATEPETLPQGESVTIQGRPGTISREKDKITITWATEYRTYRLEGNLPEAELLRIAEGAE